MLPADHWLALPASHELHSTPAGFLRRLPLALELRLVQEHHSNARTAIFQVPEGLRWCYPPQAPQKPRRAPPADFEATVETATIQHPCPTPRQHSEQLQRQLWHQPALLH